MQTVNSIDELKKWVRESRGSGKTIGLVPTMGFLHEGHLSLIQKAKAENDLVLISIFVNPAQFGPNEDFDRYPRDFERDRKLAEQAGADLIFAPDSSEVYPRESSISITAGAMGEVLCGATRPGHFDGVLKVVVKLFHMAEPDRAYFGQKDAQQLAIIESLVEDFNFPMEIRRGETIREDDGLAKSSRNVYLTEKERLEAPTIKKALDLGKNLVLNQEDPVPQMTELLRTRISGRIDYIELLSYPTLDREIKEDAILAVAIQFERARLIDNIIFNVKGN
ncbi:MAG TPA: pantoate--beta-alanine ligase [Planococcus sp. (in: firmicutes)]|nr:pantoate--beta-alanine ligase [Planococcus sp. (in: firmicutes)]